MASFCALHWFALPSALLHTHRPLLLPLDSRAVTRDTRAQAGQKHGMEAAWSQRHSPARVARVSSLRPVTLQVWHSASCKQITKTPTLTFPNPPSVLSCVRHWRVRYDLSAASQGRFHMGAWLTINVFTPLMLLSFPKSRNQQGMWQFPDKTMLCRCT